MISDELHVRRERPGHYSVRTEEGDFFVDKVGGRWVVDDPYNDGDPVTFSTLRDAKEAIRTTVRVLQAPQRRIDELVQTNFLVALDQADTYEDLKEAMEAYAINVYETAAGLADMNPSHAQAAFEDRCLDELGLELW